MNHNDLLEAIGAEREPNDGEHESFSPVYATPADVERVWREFWLPAIRDEHGKVSLAKLKRELFDAYHLIMTAPLVYRHVTGGMCDDPCASAEGIIALADRKLDLAVQARLESLTIDELLERVAQLRRELPHVDA